MRVAIAAGGSGGHVIPALTVLDALMDRAPATEAAFFGPDDRGERELLGGRNLAFYRVPSAAMRGRSPLAMARGAVRVIGGIVTAAQALRSYRPTVVFSTGGYASFPTCLAARLLRVPVVVFLPDVEPGWAVRAERSLAGKIATTTEAALAHLPRRKTVVTGYPVRAEFFRGSRSSSRAVLGLRESDAVLLVAGASQGARAINRALFAVIADVLAGAHVFHVTGTADAADAERLRESLPEPARGRYHPSSFRDDLPTVMLAADLAVLRAGASTLGELPAAALPAILIPGTYAGGHQRDNARWLAAAGAAIVLEESAIAELGPRLTELLGDRDRLSAMHDAAWRLARPAAAHEIAGLVMQEAEK